jgi:hypothetical protein
MMMFGKSSSQLLVMLIKMICLESNQNSHLVNSDVHHMTEVIYNNVNEMLIM